jgi:hypothetical protein
MGGLEVAVGTPVGVYEMTGNRTVKRREKGRIGRRKLGERE